MLAALFACPPPTASAASEKSEVTKYARKEANKECKKLGFGVALADTKAKLQEDAGSYWTCTAESATAASAPGSCASTHPVPPRGSHRRIPQLLVAAGLRQRPAAGPGDWLLSAAERGNDATRLRAWTEGNDARALVDGGTYFPVLAANLAKLGAGDTVMVGGWRCDGDERLGPAGPTVAQALRGAAQRGPRARRGAGPAVALAPQQPGLSPGAEPADRPPLSPPSGAGAAGPAGPRAGLPPPEVRRGPARAASWRRCRVRRRDRPRPGQPRRRRGTPATRSPSPPSTRYGPTPAEHDVHVSCAGPWCGRSTRCSASGGTTRPR